ncbi:MAG: S41 family peptidase [Planctomycetes bacterium]|nr:S41 family peptidase [Planctomycetota bacterium]
MYIFEEVAAQAITHLKKQDKTGAYDKLDTLHAFSAQLTQDLQAISHDLHFSVTVMPPRMITDRAEVDQEAMRRNYLNRARRSNYGFRKLEILPGNVGYLDLRQFADASIGGPTAIAAMNYLAGCESIIIDLRSNGGGSPSMIGVISSYFFDKPTHLNDFYTRSSDSTQEFWTHAEVQGPRLTDTPLYILTGARTFSAAEEFSYNFRNLKRATLVGETTGGGAHPVSRMQYPQHGVSMSLPSGRAINPITGTNWEGVGVKPHIEVPAREALDRAYAEALDQILTDTEDEVQKRQLQWVLEGLQAKEVRLSPGQQSAFSGTFGPRRIWAEKGQMFYQRGSGATLRLTHMGNDHFDLEGLDSFRIRFERSADGKVTTLVGRYDEGREEANPRNE